MRIVLVYGRASMGDALYLDFAFQEISRHGVRLRLGANVFAAVAALAVAKGPIGLQGMTEHLYGEQEDGGPERAEATVRVTVWHARKALRLFGVEVTTGPFGWQRGGKGILSTPKGPRRGWRGYRGSDGSGCTRSTLRRKDGPGRVSW